MSIKPKPAKYLTAALFTLLFFSCQSNHKPSRIILIDTATVSAIKPDTGIVAIKAIVLKSKADTAILIERVMHSSNQVATHSSIIEVYDNIHQDMPIAFRKSLEAKNTQALQLFSKLRSEGVLTYIDTIDRERMSHDVPWDYCFVGTDDCEYHYKYRKLQLQISTPISFTMMPGEERSIAFDEFRPKQSNIGSDTISIHHITLSCTPTCTLIRKDST